MATTPYFEIDPTGTSSINRIEKEQYNLQINNNNVKAISITMGCFFTDSVVIFSNDTNKTLTVGIDYVFTEIYTSLSIIYGKQIAGTILIINQSVGTDLLISYNFLGSDYKVTVPAIANSINIQANSRVIPSLQWDLINNAKTFIPDDYAAQIGPSVGFETIIYGLESITSSMLYDGYNLDTTIGAFLDTFTTALTSILQTKVDTEYADQIQQIKDKLTKDFLGLGNVVNLPMANEELVKYTVVRDYQFDVTQDGYIGLRALAKFKDEIYNTLLSADETSIGKYFGVYALPLLTTLYSLKNGGGFIIDSLSASTIAGIAFDKVVYPNLTQPNDKWSIVKLINNANGQGGVLFGTNMTTGELYVGQLTNTITDSNVLTWTKLYSEVDQELALKALTDHINDNQNPHKTDKFGIQLGNVENLEPADYNDLACRVPSDKYVTHKFLLAFMNTYMNGLQTADDLKNIDCSDGGDAAAKIINNIKLVFAPCGPCGKCCEPNLVPVVSTTTAAPVIVDPYGQLTSWFCSGGKRWDVLTDGLGGTFTQEHTYTDNDPDIITDGCIIITTTTARPVTYTVTVDKTSINQHIANTITWTISATGLTENTTIYYDIIPGDYRFVVSPAPTLYTGDGSKKSGQVDITTTATVSLNTFAVTGDAGVGSVYMVIYTVQNGTGVAQSVKTMIPV